MNEDDLSRLKLVAMYTLRKAGSEATDKQFQVFWLQFANNLRIVMLREAEETKKKCGGWSGTALALFMALAYVLGRLSQWLM